MRIKTPQVRDLVLALRQEVSFDERVPERRRDSLLHAIRTIEKDDSALTILGELITARVVAEAKWSG